MSEPAENQAEKQEPPIVRGPGGRFQRAALPPLSERMAAIEQRGVRPKPVEGDSTAEGDRDGEAADTSPATAPAPKPGNVASSTNKPEDSGATPDAGKAPKPKRETVEVEPNENKFTKERLAFTEWKRRQREGFEAQLRAERQKFDEETKARLAQFDKERSEWNPHVERAKRVLALMESADYEGLAQEAGHENWDGFQKHVMGTVSDPNYKRTRELERIVKERDERDRAEREERDKRETAERQAAEQRAQQQKRAQMVLEHKQGLAAAMAKSQDRAISALSDDPMFVDAIFEIQRENYDPTTDTTVTPEQAIKMALKGAPRTMLEHLTLMRERLNRALGEAVAEAQATEEAPATAGEKAKPKISKTAVVPSTATVEPAAAGKFKGPRDPNWKAYFAQRMAEAETEAEQAKLASRKAKGGR